MFLELNIEPSIGAIANHYQEFLNCLYIDDIDKTHIPLKEHSSIIFKDNQYNAT